METVNISSDHLFAALSHPLRLRLLLLLQHAEGEELCVCDLSDVLKTSQPMISRHLAQLRQWGLVCNRRQGLWIYYRLQDHLPAWIRKVLTATAEGFAEETLYEGDFSTMTAIFG